MGVLVQALHDLGKRLNMRHFGLAPIPLRERLDLAQVGGIGDTAFAARVQRIFQRLHTGEILNNEVGIAPEFIALVEILGPVVGQLDTRYSGNQTQRHQNAGPQQHGAPADDEIAEAIEETGFAFCRQARPQRQNGQ